MYFIIFISLVVLFFVKHLFSKPKNFPPGPPRLPIWGSYWILLAMNYKFPHLALHRLSQYYKSKIIGLYLGPFRTAVTFDYKTTHEMLTRPEFIGRPDNFVLRLRAFEKRLGLFFVEGQYWLEQRRFTLRNLRDFGLGRRMPRLENALQEEIQDMLNLINNGPKSSIDEEIVKEKHYVMIPDIFYSGFMNAYWIMMAGDRFTNENKSIQKLIIKNVLKFQRSGDPTGGALTMSAWIRYFIPQKSAYIPVKESNEILQEFICQTIDNHLQTYSEDADRDFIDRYLTKLKAVNNEKNSSFSKEQLLLIGVDLLIPSIAASTALLGFTIMHILHNPHVQVKLQEEIDRVVGKGRLPTLDDRPMLPYVEATIREGMRRESLNPLGIQRECIEDTTLGGYFIPKGTMMLPALWSVHMDLDLWKDPYNFRPERFIDENGKLIKSDLTMPFGAGKRVCVGETFSRQNMFLYFTALFQNFNLSVPDNTQLPDLTYQNYINGVNVGPNSFWIHATPRS